MQPIEPISAGQQQRAFIHVTLVVLLLAVIACGLVIASSEKGILAFALIGTRFSEGDPDGTTGYDGQFVYFIARDGADAVPYIDGPTLRYQRILLPLLGRVLALGMADLVPWILLVINILAHSIGAGLIAYLVEGFGASGRLAGFTYGLWIGSVFAVRFTLTETLSMTLALGAILAYTNKRYRLTIFLLMLSVLAKEIGLVIAGGLALHAFFQRKWGWSLLILGGPVLMFLTWWGVMRLWLGTLPTIYPAARNIRLIPLNGMFSVYAERGIGEFILVIIWVGIPCVLLLSLALLAIGRRRELTPGAALALAGVGFVMVMPGLSWQDQVAVYRVALPMILGGLLLIGQHYPRLLIVTAIWWLTPLSLLFLLPVG